METTQGRGDTQRDEKKAVAHGRHTHSHTLIFMSSFCEMTLSEVMATKVHSYLRGESRSSAPN